MRFSFLIGASLCYSLSFGQNLDSLVARLPSAETADQQVAIRVMLYQILRQDSSQLALHYLHGARDLMTKIDDKLIRAKLYSALGGAFYDERKTDSSLNYLDQALAIFEKNGDLIEYARVLADIGLNYYSQNRLERAMETYVEALRIMEAQKRITEVIDLQNRTAFILIQQEQYTQALEYLFANLKLAHNTGAMIDLVKGSFNIANVLKRDGQLERALAYCDSTIGFSRQIDMDFGIAKASGMKAYVLLDLHRPAEALSAIQEAEVIFQRMESRVDLFQMALARARVAQENAEYEQMWSQVIVAKNKFGDIQDNELKLELFDAEYEAAVNTGRYREALQAGEQRSALRDSIFKISNAEKINQLLTRYETEKKDREIEQLEYKSELQELKISQRNSQLIAAAVGSLVLGLVGFLYFQRRKFEHRQAASDMEQRLLRLQMNPHFIFNALGSIQNYILTNQTIDSVKYLAKFSRLMRQILEHSREEYISLKEEISMLRNYLEIQQLRFEQPFRYEIEVDSNLDLEEIKIPPLFAQPFVENAIEHGIMGQAEGFVGVAFFAEPGRIKVVISDSGGTVKSLENVKEHRSLATTITRERLGILSKLWKQSFTLDIVQTTGTAVTMYLPRVDQGLN